MVAVWTVIMENDAGFSSPDFGGRGSYVSDSTIWPLSLAGSGQRWAQKPKN